MSLRVAKVLLMAGVAFFYTILVFNNITDYNSNFQFVRHVLAMDTTFPGNSGMWRALTSPAVHTLFYVAIIAWEFVTMVLAWWAVVRLGRDEQRDVAVAALTLSLLMWLVAFLTVGGEWFLMWQSTTWNGQDPAFRMFAIVALVLLIVIQPDVEPRYTRNE